MKFAVNSYFCLTKTSQYFVHDKFIYSMIFFHSFPLIFEKSFFFFLIFLYTHYTGFYMNFKTNLTNLHLTIIRQIWKRNFIKTTINIHKMHVKIYSLLKLLIVMWSIDYRLLKKFDWPSRKWRRIVL